MSSPNAGNGPPKTGKGSTLASRREMRRSRWASSDEALNLSWIEQNRQCRDREGPGPAATRNPRDHELQAGNGKEEL